MSLSPPAGTTVVFLGGLGRSGSTLLERMLGEVPGVTCLGEVVHLWERALRDDQRCGCGTRFSACPFWQEVGRRAFGGWDTLDPEPVLALKQRVDRTRYVLRLGMPALRPSVRHDLAAYLDLYERVYAAAAEITGARVVIDSSKHASLAYCLRWSQRLDLRVLHVVRDSPAVAYSWTRQVHRPEVAPGAADLMPQYGVLRVVARWNVDNMMFDLLAALRTRVRVVRYEDLVQDPRAGLAHAAAHAGLPLDPEGLSFLHGQDAQLRPTHTVAGNPMRFLTGTLAVRSDDAWREELPPAARRAVSLLTAPVRARFGYPTPVPACPASAESRS